MKNSDNHEHKRSLFSVTMKIDSVSLCCAVAPASVRLHFLVTNDFSHQDPKGIKTHT